MLNLAARRKYEEIAEHFRLQIYEGYLREGDKLPSERDIAKSFDVGRSSVREAMFTLARLGLVSLQSGARARVKTPGPEEAMRQLTTVVRIMLRSSDAVRQMQQVRLLVESAVARQAALDATSEALAAINKALAVNEAAIGDPERFMRADLEFHHAVADAVRNEMLTAALQSFSTWLYDQRQVTVAKGANQAEVVVQHRAVADAIEARDPVAAFDAMEAHIKVVNHLYWSNGFGTRGNV
jgi:GntR family transcriptional regulator, sialic acid-inducible nan operon repressor